MLLCRAGVLVIQSVRYTTKHDAPRRHLQSEEFYDYSVCFKNLYGPVLKSSRIKDCHTTERCYTEPCYSFSIIEQMIMYRHHSTQRTGRMLIFLT